MLEAAERYSLDFKSLLLLKLVKYSATNRSRLSIAEGEWKITAHANDMLAVSLDDSGHVNNCPYIQLKKEKEKVPPDQFFS